jgi:aspartate-semialdehyde dehydrogenase
MLMGGRLRVAIAGSTGMVGRRFAELLVDNPWFQIDMLVGHKAVGQRYGQVWERKEKLIQEHYGNDFWHVRSCPEQLRNMCVSSFEELINSDSVDIIFSAMPSNASELEQALIDSGRLVFSNSPYGRFDERNPLVVTEVNCEEIKNQTFIKNPNCVTSGLSMILEPIRARYGLKEVSLVTFQSLSGKGDAKYETDLVVGNVYPLRNSSERTEEYIRQEIHRIFKESIPISVSCYRVFVQEGHLVNLKIRTEERVRSKDEVIQLLRNFNPLATRGLPSSHGCPLVVLPEAGRPRPFQDSMHNGGMTVAVGGICTTDDVFDLGLTYVVNNLIRGAAGGAILNSEFYVSERGGVVGMKSPERTYSAR